MKKTVRKSLSEKRKNDYWLKEKYTLVHYALREAYDVTITEYCILTTIFNFTPLDSFCTLSKKNLSSYLHLSEPTVYTAIKRLSYKGLIQKNEYNKFNVSELVYSDLKNKPGGRFSIIHHEFRKFFDFTFNDCCVLAIIYGMSNAGYKNCFASKGFFAKELGITERGVHKIFDRLINGDYLNKKVGTYTSGFQYELTEKVKNKFRKNIRDYETE